MSSRIGRRSERSRSARSWPEQNNDRRGSLGDDRRGRRGAGEAHYVRDGQSRKARRRHPGGRLGARYRAQDDREARLLFSEDPVPRNLRFLPDTEYVSRGLPADLPEDTLFVFFDMSSVARAGEYLPAVARKNILNIDHHLGNERFGAFNYIIESEASTGSCVLLLLQAMRLPITPAVATCLLTCIMTDTGGFMHSNTTPDVLRTAAMLMEAGADKVQI